MNILKCLWLSIILFFAGYVPILQDAPLVIYMAWTMLAVIYMITSFSVGAKLAEWEGEER